MLEGATERLAIPSASRPAHFISNVSRWSRRYPTSVSRSPTNPPSERGSSSGCTNMSHHPKLRSGGVFPDWGGWGSVVSAMPTSIGAPTAIRHRFSAAPRRRQIARRARESGRGPARVDREEPGNRGQERSPVATDRSAHPPLRRTPVLMPHPAVLRNLVEQYVTLRTLHAEDGGTEVRRRMDDVAYT